MDWFNLIMVILCFSAPFILPIAILIMIPFIIYDCYQIIVECWESFKFKREMRRRR